MSILFTCPPASEIASPTLDTCPFRVGQIQKLLIQRKLDSGTRNGFLISVADPDTEASWTAALAASDNTKVAVSGYVENPTQSGGDPIKEGGGNETLNGVEVVTGYDPVVWTFDLRDKSSAEIASYRAWAGEELQVYPIDEFGRILGHYDDITTPLNFYGIPIQQWNLGPKTVGGFHAYDRNVLSFEMTYDWDEKLAAITPANFTALTDLVNA